MIKNIINAKEAKLDKNGIYVVNLTLSEEEKGNQHAWERIYNFKSASMKKDREDFFVNKLQDHIAYIEKAYTFSNKKVYLEIGCGPGYIGEYLMKKYHCSFVGVDFNYPMLVNLKKYLTEKGYTDFILVYADVKKMPIQANTIDFIYGGGVIEHFKDTQNLLQQLYRILRKDGVAFNTVPAFNLFWLARSWNSIPAATFLRKPFELLHLRILKSWLLSKYHGYELSFTLGKLYDLHKKVGFKSISGGAFAFHPSSSKMKSKVTRDMYYFLSKQKLFSPMYYIVGKK
ncbi:MAG: class I SAM-dependent methyltransferase [Patescibacteria group bacterium]